MELSALKTRIETLLKKASEPSDDLIAAGNELLQGALTVMSAVYGSESHHVKALQGAAKEVLDRKTGRLNFHMSDLKRAVKGALENVKAELDSGLAGSLQKRMTSEVLTDLVQLARVVLDQSGDSAKNVAAVLVTFPPKTTPLARKLRCAVMGRREEAHDAETAYGGADHHGVERR
ncbi:MAG: hypothetical protein ACREI9_02965, partial [Nitrospiraceae bacterium]